MEQYRPAVGLSRDWALPILSLIVCALLVAGVVVFVLIESVAAVEKQYTRFSVLLKMLANASAIPLVSRDHDGANDLLSQLKHIPEVRHAYIKDHNHVIFVRYEQSGDYSNAPINASAERAIVDDDGKTIGFLGLGFGTSPLSYVREILVGLVMVEVFLVVALAYAIRNRRQSLHTEQELYTSMEQELQTAHDLQMGLMPAESPQIQGFDITGRCIPANHVGGDFFQYFSVSDNRLAISLADVTGHAMEAAVPVMMFSGILDTQMETGDNLEDLFPRINRSLCRNLADRRTYVCFTMGELDTASKVFRLSNGGCPYPYHFRASNSEITELQVDAYPLGVRIETIYPVIETQLEQGDRIVFCSDGIIEAENSERELFGFDRTANTIRNGCSQNLTAPQLLDHIISEVKTFTGDAPQGDDQTVVVLQVEV